MRDAEAVEEVINGVVRDFGSVDILICSAGVADNIAAESRFFVFYKPTMILYLPMLTSIVFLASFSLVSRASYNIQIIRRIVSDGYVFLYDIRTTVNPSVLTISRV